jgi:tyrosinase
MWLDTLIFGLLVTFSRGTPVIVPQAAPRQAGDTGVVLTTGLSSGIVEGKRLGPSLEVVKAPANHMVGHVPIRREIRDLKENFPEQFNLFILGLRSFQLSDQSDPESFYEIAG